jgi:MFS transporter, ACS family, solute carrier family 17 (sodium-dependent inorganic phosphate cotransporter), other
MPLSAILANYWGWESIFYVFGAFGCLWFIAFVLIVKEGPEHDRWISDKEKRYIMSKLNHDENDKEKPPIPWKAIFKSMPVWAIAVSHFSENWGFYTLLTQLPAFLKDTLEFELEETGFLSAVPYLTMGCLLFVSGYLADWTQIKGYLTTTQVRKYFNCGAFLCQMVFMMLAAYFLDKFWTVFCITTALGCGAFAWSGFIVNPLDIAPQYASILMGVSNTLATIPGMVSPSLTGFIVQTKVNEI